MKLQRYLNEKTYKIHKQDLEILYAPLDSWVKRLKKLGRSKDFDGDLDKIIKSTRKLKENTYFGLHVIGKITSDKFISPDLVKAHEIKPIEVFVGFIKHSMYFPSDSAIRTGLHYLTIKIIDDEKSILPVKRSLDKTSILGSFRHELTHWVDDALHGYISKVFSAPELAAGYEELGLDVYMTDMEINALISSVVGLKRKYSHKWDKITFEQMTKMRPGFTKLRKKLGRNWKILMLKRMAREGLVGKKMR
jgi:hypothetical protein